MQSTNTKQKWHKTKYENIHLELKLNMVYDLKLGSCNGTKRNDY